MGVCQFRPSRTPYDPSMGTRDTQLGATQRTRTLRSSMSNTERQPWSVIRRRALGWRFRRQFPIGPFTLDFYCPALRLAVEVDGTHHDERKARDAARDAYLRAQEIATLRFRTIDVIDNLEGVHARLERVCLERANSLGCLDGRRRDTRRIERARARRKAPPP